MKKVVFIFLVFQSLFLMAQEPPKMQKYVAKNAANIFYYDEDEVPKNIKVKKENKVYATKKLIKTYNNKIRDISFLNSQKLSDLDLLVNSLGNQLITNRELADNVRKNIETTIIPIRDSIAKNEKILNAGLEAILSKKQNKKWLKYQRKQKAKLIPKRPSRRSNSRPTGGMNRNRRGGLNQRRF